MCFIYYLQVNPLSADENKHYSVFVVWWWEKNETVAFNGFISDFIDIFMELLNNKIPRNGSGGHENKDRISHTELHRLWSVGLKKRKLLGHVVSELVPVPWWHILSFKCCSVFIYVWTLWTHSGKFHSRANKGLTNISLISAGNQLKM